MSSHLSYFLKMQIPGPRFQDFWVSSLGQGPGSYILSRKQGTLGAQIKKCSFSPGWCGSVG